MDFLLNANGLGKHGLCLWGGGDWNDSINNAGIKGKGESVWLGFFLYNTLIDFAVLADKKGDSATAEEYRRKASELAENIGKYAKAKKGLQIKELIKALTGNGLNAVKIIKAVISGQ